MQIRYLPPARDEFLAALDFYESESPGLGAEFDAELQEVEQRLLAHPESGAPFDRGTRRALFPSFPFSVIYELVPDEILVVALNHHRRDPNYWKARRP